MKIISKWLFYPVFLILFTLTSCLQDSGSSGGNIDPDSGIVVPENLAASQGTYTDRITLQWDAVSGVDHYNLYLSNSANGTYIDTDFDATTTSIYIPETTGTHYFFKITSEDGIGNESGLSNFAEGWSNPGGTGALNAPTGLTASMGTYTDRIALSWNSVTGAVYYFIYRAASANGNYELIGYLDAPAVSSYNSTTSPSSYPITVGTHYFYKITAADSSYNESAFSNSAEGYAAAAVVVPVPGGVTASQGTYTDRITISWNIVSGAAYYHIYRSTSSAGSYTYIGSVTSTSTYNSTTSPASYPITVGTHYFYKVVAEDGSGNLSAFSSYAEGYATAAVVVPAPTGVTASQGTYTDRITLSWNIVSGAVYYHVYRSTSSGGSYTYIGSVTSTSTYNSTTEPASYPVTAGTHYFYKVVAEDGSGNLSAFSSYAEGYTTAAVTIPSAPGNLSATAVSGYTGVVLTWTDSSNNETGFKVYRSTSSSSGFSLVYTTGVNVTSYTDYGYNNSSFSTINPNTTYYYRVYSYNTAGDSGYTAASAKTGNAPLLSGPASASTSFNVTWSFTWGALGSTSDHYSLEYSYYAGSSYSVLVNTPWDNRTSPWTETLIPDVTDNNRYVYLRVRAYQNISWSNYSNVIRVYISGVQ